MWESPISVELEKIGREYIDEQERYIVQETHRITGIKVDKEELVKALSYDRRQYEKGYADGKKDAVKHGRWLTTDAYPHEIYCSNCYETYALDHWGIWIDESLPRNYCPNCGAKMDE